MARVPARSARVLWLSAALVVALLSLGGWLLAQALVRADQRTAAAHRAQADRARAEVLLERAKGELIGLGQLLSAEPVAGEQRFAFLAGTMITSLDLVDAVWVTGSGSRLVVRYATTITPGTDVSAWPALAAPIATQQTVFAATASRIGHLHGQPGFWLVESSRFGQELGSSGYLALFIPAGWMTLSLEEAPTQVAVDLGGQRLEGATGSPTARARFLALGQSWEIRSTAPAPTSIDAGLPWFALAWPWLVGLLAGTVASAVRARRRAEHAAQRLFDFSLDMLAIADHTGTFVHVNPAFTQTLGYTSADLTARPFLDFVVPEDHARTRAAFERLLRGEEVVAFENRYRHRDGSIRWLEWSARPVPAESRLYAAARDITERRNAEQQLRKAERTLRASRDRLRQLADEHAAVRRVALLVARAVPPAELFTAVAREVRDLLDGDAAVLLRYEAGDTTQVLAADAVSGVQIEPGLRQALADDQVAGAVRAWRPDTVDSDVPVSRGRPSPCLVEQGLDTGAAAPITVDAGLWGMIEVAWRAGRPVPARAAQRLTHFADLVATAIANAHSRAELTASRARVVAAADNARRRIERDLHDGTQQRLVTLALALRVVEAQVPAELAEVRRRIAEVADGLGDALADLQEVSRGIHPAILSRGGLGPALRALARRSSLPAQLDAELPGRFKARIEVAAYYLVSEALTNAAKHAQATHVTVRARCTGAALEVEIADDGAGGADPAAGSGLVGLLDRVHAVGGSLDIHSEPGHGSRLRAVFPLAESPDERSELGLVSGAVDPAHHG